MFCFILLLTSSLQCHNAMPIKLWTSTEKIENKLIFFVGVSESVCQINGKFSQLINSKIILCMSESKKNERSHRHVCSSESILFIINNFYVIKIILKNEHQSTSIPFNMNEKMKREWARERKKVKMCWSINVEYIFFFLLLCCAPSYDKT